MISLTTEDIFPSNSFTALRSFVVCWHYQSTPAVQVFWLHFFLAQLFSGLWFSDYLIIQVQQVHWVTPWGSFSYFKTACCQPKCPDIHQHIPFAFSSVPLEFKVLNPAQSLISESGLRKGILPEQEYHFPFPLLLGSPSLILLPRHY